MCQEDPGTWISGYLMEGTPDVKIDGYKRTKQNMTDLGKRQIISGDKLNLKSSSLFQTAAVGKGSRGEDGYWWMEETALYNLLIGVGVGKTFP